MAYSVTLRGLQRFEHWLDCRSARSLLGKSVRIWSAEHGAWWRPDYAGYTTHLPAAGIYDFQDAYMHTKHCGPEKKISYHVVRIHSLKEVDNG